MEPKETQTLDLAYVDELTGLYNRRYMNLYTNPKIEEMSADAKPLSLVMLDVDSFKGINDTFGHQVGDRVLIHVAEIIKKCIQRDDVAIRYAGDEFTIILPQVPSATARKICQRIADRLSKGRIRARGSIDNVTITLSMGIAQFPEDGNDLETLLGQADRALYYSKHKGKNRISSSVDIPADLITDSDRFKIFPAPETVGRAKELEHCAEKIEETLSGRPRFILYEGIPGIGKTRLLDELVTRAQQNHLITLVEKCLEVQVDQPFGVLVKLIDAFLMKSTGDKGRFVSNLSDAELAAVTSHIPELATVEGISEKSSDPEASEQETRYHLYSALQRLLQNIADEGPSLVVLDDMQWVDEATLMLLGSLTRAEREIPLCVIGAFNSVDTIPEPQPLHKLKADGMISGEIEVRRLEPLTEDQTAELIGLIFKDIDQAQWLAGFVHERAAGNPLFIEEMLKFMLRMDLIYREQYQWKIRPFSLEEIPSDLSALVEGRIASLHEEVRDVSKDASAIGQKIDLETLKKITNQSEGVLLEFMKKAMQENLLLLRDREDGCYDIHFKTPSLRDVLYNSIPKERRKDLHLQIGEFEEERPDQDLRSLIWTLVYHFKRSEALQKAEKYGTLATRQATRLFRPEEAHEYESRQEEEELAGPPLNEDQITRANVFIRSLRVTIQRVQVYTSNHKVALNAIEDLYRKLDELLQEVQVLMLSEVEGCLVINDTDMHYKIDLTGEQGLIALMREFGLSSIAFKKGLRSEEFFLFLESMTKKRDVPLADLLKRNQVQHIRLNRTKYVKEGAEGRKRPRSAPRSVEGAPERDAPNGSRALMADPGLEEREQPLPDGEGFEPGGEPPSLEALLGDGLAAWNGDEEALAAGPAGMNPEEPDIPDALLDEPSSQPRDKRLTDYIESLSSGRPLRWDAELQENLPNLMNALAADGRGEALRNLVGIVIQHMKSLSKAGNTNVIRTVDGLLGKMRFPGSDPIRSDILIEMLRLFLGEERPEMIRLISESFVHQIPVLMQGDHGEILSKIVHVLDSKYMADEEAPAEKRSAAESVFRTLTRDDLFDLLLSDIGSGNPRRQALARHLLGKLGPRAAEPLIEIVKANPDARARKSAVSILREIGEPAMLRILEEMTVESSPPALKSLIRTCEAFGEDPTMVKHMVHLLSHDSTVVRIEALRAFARIDSPETKSVLISTVRSEDSVLQQEAVHLIGLHNHVEASDALIELLDDKKASSGEDGAELQRRVCIALGKLRAQSAVPHLETIVKSKRTLFFRAQAPEIVRAAAVWALGKIGGEQSIRIIREMNQEKAPTVKTAVDLVLSRESAG